MIPLITLGVSLGGGVLGSWLLAHLVNDGVGLGLQLNGGRGVLEKGPETPRGGKSLRMVLPRQPPSRSMGSTQEN